MSEAERVAVGSRTCDPAVRDAASGGAIIFDHYGLAEHAAHTLRKDPTDRIRRSAGGRTDHHRDRPGRKGLCPRDARNGRERGGARGQMQKLSAWKFHFRHHSHPGRNFSTNALSPELVKI